MKMCIVAVRDRAADLYGAPTFVQSLGIAIRSFGDLINGESKGDGSFSAHPEDYDLFSLGTYDDQTGSFECHVPKQIAIGKELRIARS